MKVTLTINNKPVDIELTADQVADIKKKSEKITDRVKTFEDACGVLGLSVSDVLSTYDTKDEAAYKKLKTIVSALNEGWEPNWTNSSEYKYYPWFEYKSGFGFSESYAYYIWSFTSVGSRLVYKSRELCEYGYTQFKDIYNDYLV